MRRPRNPVPAAISRLTYDIRAKRYSIQEGETVYLMDLEETRLLKAYYRANERGFISDWCNSLQKSVKQKIERIGKIPEEFSDFYPDYTPQD